MYVIVRREVENQGLLRNKNAQNPRLKCPVIILVLSSKIFLKREICLVFPTQPKLLPSCRFSIYLSSIDYNSQKAQPKTKGKNSITSPSVT